MILTKASTVNLLCTFQDFTDLNVLKLQIPSIPNRAIKSQHPKLASIGSTSCNSTVCDSNYAV